MENILENLKTTAKNIPQQFQHRKGREFQAAMLLGGPAFILLFIFMVWPFIKGIELSRTNQLSTGQQGRNVGWTNFERLISINFIEMPEVPPRDELPVEFTRSGWYIGSDGELQFRWRDLESQGLGRWDSENEADQYNIVKMFDISGTYYAIIAKDPLFWRSLFHNFYFVLLVVPIQTSLALLLAILVNQKLKGMNIYRTTYFSPVVTAMAVITVVWIFMYNPSEGLINKMLGVITGQDITQDWVKDPRSAMPAVMILSIWQGVGFQMIIYLAGLQDIPEDLYEAAEMDGASVFSRFRYITLPMLKNTTIFVVLTTTILAFRLFDQVQVMVAAGAPQDSVGTIVWYAIQTAQDGFVGKAASISIMFVIVVLLVSMLQRVFVRPESALD